ncbi:MAG: phage tail family protein [Candidatus Pacearchaeota archaeon]|jgi:predicted phage tail component-like protein
MSLDFSLNGTDASDKGFTTHNVYKDILDQQRRYSLDPPDRDGEIEVGKKFPPRIIKVEGRLVGTSYSNLVTSIIPAFSSYLYNDNDVQLIFSDETDRYFNAQVNKVTIRGYYSAWRLLDIEFICNDPFAYDTTADTDTQSSITVDDTTYNVTNSGHYYTYPVITITFNQAQTHIYIQNNTVSGNRFDITKNFNIADELEVDCKNMTIKLNGSHSPSGFGDGGDEDAEMIVFATGVNEIQVGTDDASIDVDIEMIWRKVYLS